MARYVIVGGVAGGATAAARLRRQDEAAEIVILERGEYVSFANCGLPYYVGGVIGERDALLVSTPQKLREELAVDVRTRHEVLHIDREAKAVAVRDLSTGDEYRLSYDKLILSPGARPVVPPIPGVDLPGVYTLRTIPDTDVIKRMVDEGGVESAVVVGGGFIGLEMAENLIHRGVRVTIVEMMNQVLAPLDYEMAALVHDHLREQGVVLALGSALEAIEEALGGGLLVRTANGSAERVDMVVLAIGVRPESGLAQEAGLEIGPRGHVVTDEHLRTSDPDIYAVGDAIQVVNPVTGAPCAVPLAGPANRQARIAADHITGDPEARYRGTLGTSIVKVFDLTVATTGTNARGLEGAGVPFVASVTHSQDHVTYYPGATEQTVRILYRPEDGRLLGAQVVGRNAVDRSIDALAVALQAGLTVYDLERLELAYAPPYGAAKDPINVAGYVAANRLRGTTKMVEWQELARLQEEGVGVLDVRSTVEFDLGHLPGAINIPHTELRERLDELDSAKRWVVYCKIGRRAYVAERILRQHGYDVVNLTGGYKTYAAATGAAYREAPAESFGEQGGTITPASVDVGGVAERAVGGNGAAPAPAPAATAILAEEDVLTLDACGLQCPGPIMAVFKRMEEMRPAEVLRVTATDPGFARDVAAWCERTGNGLLGVERQNGHIVATLRKGQVVPGALRPDEDRTRPAAKTMVVFSGDLDRALASFVIANGALAMGQQVTMFFTFWGLNVLRREDPPRVPKNVVERVFGRMLPKGAGRLAMSKLHMGGLGTWMMKRVMDAKRIDQLPVLMQSAIDNGVRLVACQMSMDMMGIKPEELIDGVEVGGVATMINETDRSNAALFI